MAASVLSNGRLQGAPNAGQALQDQGVGSWRAVISIRI